MKEKVNRTRMVHVRLTQDEYQKLQQRFQKTTCRKFSEYLRHCLFDKPVITTYRNTSLDDFMIEMSALKKELNHIGNNYNQAVKNCTPSGVLKSSGNGSPLMKGTRFCCLLRSMRLNIT